jgi:hypothetical protein
MQLQQGFASGEMGSGGSLQSSNPESFMSALGQKRTFTGTVIRCVAFACDQGVLLGRTSFLNRDEAGIKFVAHLRCLRGKRYAAEQLICLISCNIAVEVKRLSFTPRRPVWRGKIHRYNCN